MSFRDDSACFGSHIDPWNCRRCRPERTERGVIALQNMLSTRARLCEKSRALYIDPRQYLPFTPCNSIFLLHFHACCPSCPTLITPFVLRGAGVKTNSRLSSAALRRTRKSFLGTLKQQNGSASVLVFAGGNGWHWRYARSRKGSRWGRRPIVVAFVSCLFCWSYAN